MENAENLRVQQREVNSGSNREDDNVTDVGYLSVRLWSKDDEDNEVPLCYAIAVTIQAGTRLRVYEGVRERLRVRRVHRPDTRCMLPLLANIAQETQGTGICERLVLPFSGIAA